MMSTHPPASEVRLVPMPQLVDAVDRDDDWTGLTDPVSRRKRQNRLNVRAHRRRKAHALKTNAAANVSTLKTHTAEKEPGTVPCWVEDQQTVSLLPARLAQDLSRVGTPLIPPELPTSDAVIRGRLSSVRIIFPLSPDHLITLLQYNVLRATLTNRRILSHLEPSDSDECSSAALHVLPMPSTPGTVPPSLLPTDLQQAVPHEGWVDHIPDPIWRDNVLRAIGQFDEDELWSDTIGGLFEGFPHSEIEQRGIIAWSPPWDASGWEISEGFLRKWGWTLKGCRDVIEATNKWRRMRGEDPLVYEI